MPSATAARVTVVPGERASVIVVEAMKMENELLATRSGKISKILVVAGATVEGGSNLIEIAPE